MAPLWELDENGKKYEMRMEKPHKVVVIYWQRGEKATKHHFYVPFYQQLSTSPFSCLRAVVSSGSITH